MNMRQSLHRFFPMLALLSLGCNAPRDNPYDPDADNYIGPGSSGISGRVTTYTGQALSGAEIVATPVGMGPVRGAYSNSGGYFAVTNVPVGAYLLQCFLTGFASDSMAITVSDSGLITGKNFILNGLAAIHNLQVTSRYINTPSIPSLYYQIRAQAALSLPDGINDIDAVFLRTQLGLEWEMTFDSQVQDSFYYFISINENTLPGGSVEGIIGHYFFCAVLDTAGVTVESDPATILRFLDEVPYTYSPGYGEEVFEPQPWLVWDPYSANFYFTHTARVFNNDGPAPVLYWQLANITAGEDSIQTVYLPNGGYLWNLEVIDEFGNTAISLDAAFQVIYVPPAVSAATASEDVPWNQRNKKP